MFQISRVSLKDLIPVSENLVALFECLVVKESSFLPLSVPLCLARYPTACFSFLRGGSAYEAIPVTKCQPGVFHL